MRYLRSGSADYRFAPIFVSLVGVGVTAVGINSLVASRLLLGTGRSVVGLLLITIGVLRMTGTGKMRIDSQQVESAAAQSFWLLLTGLVLQLVFQPLTPSTALITLISAGLVSLLAFYLLES